MAVRVGGETPRNQATSFLVYVKFSNKIYSTIYQKNRDIKGQKDVREYTGIALSENSPWGFAQAKGMYISTWSHIQRKHLDKAL